MLVDDVQEPTGPLDEVPDPPGPLDEVPDPPGPLDDVADSPGPLDDVAEFPGPDEVPDPPARLDDVPNPPGPLDDVPDALELELEPLDPHALVSANETPKAVAAIRREAILPSSNLWSGDTRKPTPLPVVVSRDRHLSRGS
jgi:hypothetical protein